MKQDVISLFRQWCGEELVSLESLSAHGSTRQYWRCIGHSHRCIAAWNADVRENEAFFYFASLLKEQSIAVPEVYAINAGRTLYLQQDLGNETLAMRLIADEERVVLYRKVLDDLLAINRIGQEGKVDFAKSYPRPAMDRQAWQWDFNYFKYNFLKLKHIVFDEQRLEEDFQMLIDFLLSGQTDYLMYRDFQPRNIMVTPDRLYYIDFQGARQGSPFYDVASLLYSSSSQLDEVQRADLLEYYLDGLNAALSSVAASHVRAQQRHCFYAHVLARKMQAFGAYGYRGLYEGKEQFVRSIAPAAAELQILLRDHSLPLPLPELEKIFSQIIEQCVSSDAALQPQKEANVTAKSPLCVQVFSFSYKHGYPHDDSGNGGGYAFDCRALPNPGRYAAYKQKTGKDLEVRQYLENAEHIDAVDAFFQQAAAMVSPHVENFVQRGFCSLMIGFGCTGGQHRSVYFAERMARYLHEKYPDVQIELYHKEQPQLGLMKM